jgi:diguanylate cyclase (GGDEF)-like protein
MRVRKIVKKLSRDGVLLAAVPFALIAGAWLIAKLTVDHFLYHDAVTTGHNWATYLAENVKDLEQIADGQTPSSDSQRFFDSAQKVGQVFRYVIYDPQGHFRLVSDDLDGDPDENEDLAIHKPDAARSITKGIPIVQAEEGEPPTRPPYFAEAYVPVVVKGKVVAIVETYVDQTEKRDDYRQTLVATSASLFALIGLAFGVPALAWQRRSSEKRIADAHIHFLAHHDSLTGLINRKRLESDATDALAALSNVDNRVALHYIDIDRFKDVNDTLGHSTGDALIVSVAKRLSGLTKALDRVARVGGDEFVILQTRPCDENAVRELAGSVLRELSRPHHVNGHEVRISASIGVAIAPTHGDEANRLMKSADLALYHSKAAGRNALSFFCSDMDTELAERVRLERAIRNAVTSQLFELHFQPNVEMPNRRLVGFEALIRMRDENGNIVPPATFIPVAEHMGLIDQIGLWVLREACNTAVSWPSGMKVAVNLSPAQFADGGLAETVAGILVETGLDPRRLELEITEGILLNRSEAVMAELRKLKAMNVGVVMDDFGTGYSSLSYLWKFPFDKIKIDRAFMLALDDEDHGDAATIVKTIIGLGRSLNVTVTVEGVENDRQVEFVNAACCDQIQGYYFGRPMPVTDIAAYIVKAFKSELSSNGSRDVNSAESSAA